MIERRFIAVEQPLLPALAEALVATAPASGRVDLRATAVVLPTSRACRRLRVALDRAADGRVLFAPVVCTPSMLLQQCVTPSRMIAPPLAEVLSWQRVLRQADDTTCCELMGISIYQHRTVTASERQSLAMRVQQVTAELAAACQTPADVSATIARLHLPGDRDVWMSITALQQAMREDAPETPAPVARQPQPRETERRPAKRSVHSRERPDTHVLGREVQSLLHGVKSRDPSKPSLAALYAVSEVLSPPVSLREQNRDGGVVL